MAPTPLVLEESPLLFNVGYEHCEDSASEAEEAESASQAVSQRDAKYSSALSRFRLQLYLLMLIFDFTQYASYAPLTAVFEEIICIHHYSSNSSNSSTLHPTPLPQRDCKVVPVQHELALVKGYKDSFSQIPSMFPTFSSVLWSTVEREYTQLRW
jgi:hypothetical protein